MRAFVQRVSGAQVTVDARVTGSIGRGLLVFLAVEKDDTAQDAAYLAKKILNLRIFQDPHDRMNLSVQDTGGGLLVISQFTLLGDCRKGNRPSFAAAAPPEEANRLYQRFLTEVAVSGLPVSSGRFQSHMEVTLTNHGPVTILLDSRKTS